MKQVAVPKAAGDGPLWLLLGTAMRLLLSCRYVLPLVLASLLVGCGGPKIPRKELGKVEWGIYAVPGREVKIPLDKLPEPPPMTGALPAS